MAAKQGKVAWCSPSNLALVKYWGKKGNQLPMNPSLSMCLTRSVSITEVEWTWDERKKGTTFEFRFEGKSKPDFEVKLVNFFQQVERTYALLSGLHCKIDSKNSFPHSAGIASSASAMSALALCLCSIHDEIESGGTQKPLDLTMASAIARLGSGSACRSVFPYVSLWGSTEQVPESNDGFAVGISSIHEEVRTWKNYIFLVSTAEKAVSSSRGHALMASHPYRGARIEQARANTAKMLLALQNLDYAAIAAVAEEEALSLHALMMSSNPSYILLEPESLRIIHALRLWREKSAVPVFFSIDAGPNIHVIFPSKVKDEVKNWIKRELNEYNELDRIIFDAIGPGPIRLV